MGGNMYKIPISGGPNTGKTEIIKLLETRYPEAHIVHEPATQVIAEELGKVDIDDSYIPSVPWLNYSKFGPLVMQRSIDLEAEIPRETELVFLDRSLIDTIAYAELEGCSEIAEKARKYANAASYTLAFFCEPVGTFTSTSIRREDYKKASETHELLRQTYQDFGKPVHTLPDEPLASRFFRIRDRIAELGLSAGNASLFS